MKLRHALIAVILLQAAQPTAILSQDLKEQALQEFREQRYGNAVQLLKQAVKDNPKDAELYYYLGYYTHYLCYDSVPLSGYDAAVSDTIIAYLKKALELDPAYRNVYSFLGAEYGARAIRALQKENWTDFVGNLKLGKESGGYPDWMLEYARNVLRSCGRDAILLTGGDSEAFSVWYCQFVENFRADVTQAPVALLERPWFVLAVQAGFDGRTRPFPMTWSKDQILAMRPYRWKAQVVEFPIPPEAQKKFATQDATFSWNLEPDCKETWILRAHRALMADMVRANAWERPIHFSLGCQPSMFSGLEDNLQLAGITWQLVPFNVSTSGRMINVETSFQVLSDPNNFRAVPSVKSSDIPRNSQMLQNYLAASLQVCDSLLQAKDFERARILFSNMQGSLFAEVVPMMENGQAIMDRMRDTLLSASGNAK
jgi:tetratricopeptide (TPR) repeat protein